MNHGCVTCLVGFIVLPFSSDALKREVVVYGKYHRGPEVQGTRNRIDNSYFIYTPENTFAPQKLPVVFQAYGTLWSYDYAGSGVNLGPQTVEQPYMQNYADAGIAYVSIGYRGVDYPYLYDDVESATTKPEELINVDAEGRLTLDTMGRTMADYRVRECWMELITKCVYDTVQALETLIANADRHGVDVHRVFFFASSAGSAEVNYLTWVYHKWNKERFTPVGMMLVNPQLDLPIRCAMGRPLKMYMDHADAGPNLLLKDVIPKSDCRVMLADQYCENMYTESDYNSAICNMTWSKEAASRFCNDNYDALTFGQVYQTQRWDRSDPEVGLGMEKLWDISQNMLDYQPRPFHLYACSSVVHGFQHGGMAPFVYGEIADELGLNYTVYFLDQPGLRKTVVPSYAARSAKVIRASDIQSGVLLSRSNVAWNSLLTTQDAEHVEYISYVFGLPLPQQARLYSSQEAVVGESPRRSPPWLAVGGVVAVVASASMSFLCKSERPHIHQEVEDLGAELE